MSEEFVTVVAVDGGGGLEAPPQSFVTVLAIGDDPEEADAEEVLVYRLPGERLGFGLRFEGGAQASERVRRLFVQSCAADSPAARATASWGRLAPGDQILRIDGARVSSLTRTECVRALKESLVELRLVVRRPQLPPPVPPRKTRPRPQQLVVPPRGFADDEPRPPDAEVYLDAVDDEDAPSESDDTASSVSTVVGVDLAKVLGPFERLERELLEEEEATLQPPASFQDAPLSYGDEKVLRGLDLWYDAPPKPRPKKRPPPPPPPPSAAPTPDVEPPVDRLDSLLFGLQDDEDLIPEFGVTAVVGCEAFFPFHWGGASQLDTIGEEDEGRTEDEMSHGFESTFETMTTRFSVDIVEEGDEDEWKDAEWGDVFGIENHIVMNGIHEEVTRFNGEDVSIVPVEAQTPPTRSQILVDVKPVDTENETVHLETSLESEDFVDAESLPVRTVSAILINPGEKSQIQVGQIVEVSETTTDNEVIHRLEVEPDKSHNASNIFVDGSSLTDLLSGDNTNVELDIFGPLNGEAPTLPREMNNNDSVQSEQQLVDFSSDAAVVTVQQVPIADAPVNVEFDAMEEICNVETNIKTEVLSTSNIVSISLDSKSDSMALFESTEERIVCNSTINDFTPETISSWSVNEHEKSQDDVEQELDAAVVSTPEYGVLSSESQKGKSEDSDQLVENAKDVPKEEDTPSAEPTICVDYSLDLQIDTKEPDDEIAAVTEFLFMESRQAMLDFDPLVVKQSNAFNPIVDTRHPSSTQINEEKPEGSSNEGDSREDVTNETTLSDHQTCTLPAKGSEVDPASVKETPPRTETLETIDKLEEENTPCKVDNSADTKPMNDENLPVNNQETVSKLEEKIEPSVINEGEITASKREIVTNGDAEREITEEHEKAPPIPDFEGRSHNETCEKEIVIINDNIESRLVDDTQTSDASGQEVHVEPEAPNYDSEIRVDSKRSDSADLVENLYTSESSQLESAAESAKSVATPEVPLEEQIIQFKNEPLEATSMAQITALFIAKESEAADPYLLADLASHEPENFTYSDQTLPAGHDDTEQRSFDFEASVQDTNDELSNRETCHTNDKQDEIGSLITVSNPQEASEEEPQICDPIAAPETVTAVEDVGFTARIVDGVQKSAIPEVSSDLQEESSLATAVAEVSTSDEAMEETCDLALREVEGCVGLPNQPPTDQWQPNSGLFRPPPAVPHESEPQVAAGTTSSGAAMEALTRQPPDGDEFPANYSDPLPPDSSILSKMVPPPLPVNGPPLKAPLTPPPTPPKPSVALPLIAAASPRRGADDRSERSVRDKIAMFSSKPDAKLPTFTHVQTRNCLRMQSSPEETPPQRAQSFLDLSRPSGAVTLPPTPTTTVPRRTSFSGLHVRSQSLLDVSGASKRNSIAGLGVADLRIGQMMEQRRRGLSKLRGLVIPEKVPELPVLLPDLPEIRSVTTPTPRPTTWSEAPVSAAPPQRPPWTPTPTPIPAPPRSSWNSEAVHKQPLPKYSPAFKRKSLSLSSSVSSSVSSSREELRPIFDVPPPLPPTQPPPPPPTTNEPKSLESISSPTRSDFSFEYKTLTPSQAPAGDESDDSAVSSSRSSQYSPPASPLRQSEAADASRRVLKPRSVEAINRKNVLSSARHSSGKDFKVGSPLIQRKVEDDEDGSNIMNLRRQDAVEDTPVRVAYIDLVQNGVDSKQPKPVAAPRKTAPPPATKERFVSKWEASPPPPPKPRPANNLVLAPVQAPVLNGNSVPRSAETTVIMKHSRVSSLDSTASEESFQPAVRDVMYGSISSLSSASSLITQQELQQLMDEANQSLEESGVSSPVSLEVVVLHREIAGSGVGITLAGGSDYETKEITVHKVLAGSPADRDGRIQKGDRILSINGHSMKGVTHRESLAILKAPTPEVVLVVMRNRSDGLSPQISHLPEEISPRRSVPFRVLEKLHEGVVDMPAVAPIIGERGPPSSVTLTKDGAGLGFSLEGGRDSPLGNRPLVIKKIFTGGAAERHGVLKAGDELLTVDGTDVTTMTRIEAWALMKKLPSGPVTLSIRKSVTVS